MGRMVSLPASSMIRSPSSASACRNSRGRIGGDDRLVRRTVAGDARGRVLPNHPPVRCAFGRRSSPRVFGITNSRPLTCEDRATGLRPSDGRTCAGCSHHGLVGPSYHTMSLWMAASAMIGVGGALAWDKAISASRSAPPPRPSPPSGRNTRTEPSPARIPRSGRARSRRHPARRTDTSPASSRPRP